MALIGRIFVVIFSFLIACVAAALVMVFAVVLPSWSNLFDDTAAAGLNNGTRLPFVVAMNCLNGFFHDVYTESLATALMLSRNGGAVAVWASSGLTAPTPQFQMDQSLVKTLFTTPGTSIGDAVLSAKSGIADQDVRRTFILFGDPTMKLKLPQAFNVTAPTILNGSKLPSTRWSEEQKPVRLNRPER